MKDLWKLYTWILFAFVSQLHLIVGCSQFPPHSTSSKKHLAIPILKDTHQIISLEEQATARESYYEFDTLLIREFFTESGNHIQLRGSQSEALYRVDVRSKNGPKHKFIISQDWYIASHSKILWDNENYIFVRFGCGTQCWGGKLLSLIDGTSQDYLYYLFADSTQDLVVYPDSQNYEKLIIENFYKQSRQEVQLDLCKKSAIRIDMIKEVSIQSINEVIIEYMGESCEKVKKKKIRVKNVGKIFH